MNSSVFSFLSDFVFLLLLFIQIPSSLSNDDLYSACSKKFVCGDISAGFPFWGPGRSPTCGIPELELRCENDITTMNINQVAYRVLEIKHEIEILRIAREDYLVGLCPPQFMNSFNPKIFEPVEGYEFLTFIYGCKDASTTISGPKTFTCKINDVNNRSVYNQDGDDGPGKCNGSVFVPVLKDYPQVWNTASWEWNMAAFEEQLKRGFEVRWKVDSECRECSTRVCGFDNVTSQTSTCYYPEVNMHQYDDLLEPLE
ncbi:WALL-ASSOCIATED RECEPTOR KINASE GALACTURONAN-BINDING DOMAIN-CONTAINING PROTEIN-RELATED [Salix purpurea]|uniref:non-specific serine/threonine protein kinase n=1 Tax=Salix purpurea TaxID=77065 RepID=A0A9Q0USG8_SALPP|nr:WALL-ASSOCIATED RECEPTOR KINASE GALACTURONAN-BINDING DOMAIN-CONTAINING PROTEIN-RELATED [Salix purpurea]